MIQYIDKAAVVAELERLYNLEYANESYLSCGKKIMLRHILLFLNNLEVKDDSLEKFKSLQHISGDLHQTLEDWGYAPNLYQFDGSWHVDWISCEEGDSIKDFEGNTPEEAIDKAYNWFHSLEDTKVKMSLIQYISELNQDVVHLHPGIETCNEWIAWLKKQCEQKPANKVEPKFKVGDWVVTSYGKVNQVVKVDEDGDGYTLDDNTYFSGSWISIYHPWTIQDAKEGDVLSYRDGQWIFIYKEKIDNNSFYYHTLYSTIYQDLTIGDSAFTLLIDEIVPATEKQRDLLFQKIKEAGYEWNEEEKTLIKVLKTKDSVINN